MTTALSITSKKFSKKLSGIDLTFRYPEDPDSLLDLIPEELYEKDRFLPYWAEHWPASEALFSHIVENVIVPSIQNSVF